MPAAHPHPEIPKVPPPRGGSVAYHHNLHVRYAIAEICNNKPWTGLWIFQ